MCSCVTMCISFSYTDAFSCVCMHLYACYVKQTKDPQNNTLKPIESCTHYIILFARIRLDVSSFECMWMMNFVHSYRKANELSYDFRLENNSPEIHV